MAAQTICHLRSSGSILTMRIFSPPRHCPHRHRRLHGHQEPARGKASRPAACTGSASSATWHPPRHPIQARVGRLLSSLLTHLPTSQHCVPPSCRPPDYSTCRQPPSLARSSSLSPFQPRPNLTASRSRAAARAGPITPAWCMASARADTRTLG